MGDSIGVVIVTYNRLELLKKTIEKFENQKRLPDLMIIVDNASTDGTHEFLDLWEKKENSLSKIIYHSPLNEGGSGGFWLGMEIALKQSIDWIWRSDDDAYPEENALLNAALFIEKHSDENISAICSQVINNGKIDTVHRRNYIQNGFRTESIRAEEGLYSEECFQINCFSYVGVIINKRKLKEAGPVLKEYFIRYDDTEHSLRLSKIGKIYCVPAIKVHHDVIGDENSITWKTYYIYRNWINMIKRHFPWYCYLYYVYKLCKETIKIKFSHNRQVQYKLMKAAIHDGCCNRLGMHQVYKPGWKMESL